MSEIRLIDANALLSQIPTIEDEYKYVRKLIDNAPTVETHDTVNMYCDKDTQIIVEQIRPKGEWITKAHSIEYYCSRCGERLDQCCENFCCHCGADMRGKEE